MNCPRDKLIMISIFIAVVSLVSGMMAQQITKANADVAQIRNDYREDIKTLDDKMQERFDSLDSKIDRINDYLLNHS